MNIVEIINRLCLLIIVSYRKNLEKNMKNILVTGASGNVGSQVVKALRGQGQLGISAISKKAQLASFGPGEAVLFDFADQTTWEHALNNVDKVFLLRPPAISDVKTYLFPFIDYALEKGVQQIVFLSLQGVRFNPLTPHFKVEKYLMRKKAPYTFLRPNFFMQNLITFYKDGIAQNDEIFLPAGKGRTAFVDVRDIGAVAAEVFTGSDHIGKAYTLSGSESLDYYQVAEMLTNELGRTITYQNPSVAEYVERLRANGSPEEFIKVQKMLYFVVRHNFSSGTKSDIAKLLSREPIAFKQFAHDYAHKWGKVTAGS